MTQADEERDRNGRPLWPLPNVWLGISVENQAAAEERIPLMLQTPAAVRFISAEPLLAPIDFCVPFDGAHVDALIGAYPGIPKLDWVIAGGESSPNARPMHPAWARSLRDQCGAAGVAFFFKQWGKWSPGSNFQVRDTLAIDQSGRIAPDALHANYPSGASSADGWEMMHCARGKSDTGAMLDGCEYKQFPEKESRA